jgi:hypothetical protein
MLTEQQILKSVEILPTQNAINVCWMNQILRDGEIISEIPHRCAYMQDQKDQFLADVEGGDKYVAAIGW